MVRGTKEGLQLRVNEKTGKKNKKRKSTVVSSARVIGVAARREGRICFRHAHLLQTRLQIRVKTLFVADRGCPCVLVCRSLFELSTRPQHGIVYSLHDFAWLINERHGVREPDWVVERLTLLRRYGIVREVGGRFGVRLGGAGMLVRTWLKQERQDG